MRCTLKNFLEKRKKFVLLQSRSETSGIFFEKKFIEKTVKISTSKSTENNKTRALISLEI